MAGALENITSPMRKTLSQANVNVTDNMITQLIPAVAGTRIKVVRLEIGSDTAAKFNLRSGNSDDIVAIHLPQDTGHYESAPDGEGKYICNSGEALTIQSDAAALDANVYVRYYYDSSPGDYSG